MKNLTIHQTSLSFLLFLLSCFFSLVIPLLVRASEVTISASIPDIVPPSVPILISPSDGALTSDNTPTFRWYESTDDLALSHYVFYLNGAVLFNNVPLTATDNSQYVLEYDSLNGIYSLTVKSSLTDKAHTWKVVAVDYASNSASSDTWDFTIDTLTPSFVLTKIGDTNVNISAANPSSVPSSPILIFQNDATANEPTLIANGEANSTVKLTVTIPGDPTQTFTTTINSSGQYELKLGILPRDTDIRLDFIITDQVGHVSVLEGVYFRIALQYYPTASPSPTASTTSSPSISPSLSVSVSPTSSITPILTPTVSPPLSPTGLIPIIPPREIIHEGVGEIVELLPESTADKVRDFLTSTLWQGFSLWFALFLLLLFYVLAYLLLLSKFLADLSGTLLGKIGMLLFPQLFVKSEHLVFDYGATLASPLVKVELLDENKEHLDLTVTDLGGNFDDLAWPVGKKWSLRVDDANFYFPVGSDKPKQLQFWQFYQGQFFSGENYSGQPILIPTLRAAGQEQLPLLERLRIFCLYLLGYPLWFWLLATFIALIFALRYPSLYNYLALSFYGLIGLLKLWQKFKFKQQVVLAVSLKGSERQFSDNLVVSFFDKANFSKKALVLPFDFAKAKPIAHDFKLVNLCVFAKNLALHKDGQVTGELPIELNGVKQEIILQIGKI